MFGRNIHNFQTHVVRTKLIIYNFVFISQSVQLQL